MGEIVRIVAMGIVGLCVGSIVTMVVDRVPDGLSLLRPGPRCPHCEHPIAAHDLVPVLSFFALRGVCRHCHERFTPAYPAVEIACGLAFAAAAWRIGWELTLVPYFLFFATLIAVSTVDLYEYIIPNRILFPAMGASFVLMALTALYYGEPERIAWAACGMLVFGAVLGVPAFIKPGALGIGDAKLALFMGLNLGWLVEYLDGVRLVMMATIIGFMLGLMSGLALWFARRVTGKHILADPDLEPGPNGEPPPVPTLAKTAFPFGPGLALASILSVLFWRPLLGL